MLSPKPSIFISHVHEDAQIAHCLKDFLDEAFISIFRIFVSSDGASIRAGDNWSSSIEQALTETALVLAVITNSAVEGRWIYFECGGAYFARKRVVPVCCRGFSISALSPPLSWLQAIDGSDSGGVERLIEAIAHTFDLRKPKCNAAKLAKYLTGSPCGGRVVEVLAPTDTPAACDLGPERLQTYHARRPCAGVAPTVIGCCTEETCRQFLNSFLGCIHLQ